jgi:hypothetical protein
MKRPVPRLAIGLLSMCLLQSGLSACSMAGAPNTSPGNRLLAMSAASGVQVNPEEIFTLSRSNETVTVAPVVGWEQIPATALRNGVDFGYAYFATTDAGVPAGYYRLRATANVTATGTIPGRIQLIDRSGEVRGELPAEVEVHSLTVPAQLPFPRTYATAITDGPRQLIWMRCPNGVCIRWIVLRNRVDRIR